MSRSYWHTPIHGLTGHNSSCKAWRTQENRRYRAYAKNLMRHERYDDIQGYCGYFGNEWDSPRDGKTHFFDMKYWGCGEKKWYGLWNRWHQLPTDSPDVPIPMCASWSGYHYCIHEYRKLLRK